MTDYSNYNVAVFRAFDVAGAAQDTIEKKADIINQVCKTHQLVPTSILFFGFNPAIYAIKNCTVAVTEVTDEIAKTLTQKVQGLQVINRKDLSKYSKKFDCVVAVDEYFTFANNDQEQYDLVIELAQLTKHCLITTLKDYKNLEYKEREFSLPAVIKSSPAHTLFFEYHNQNFENRGSWKSTVYQIQSEKLICYGPYSRRNMFFKQLAKFSSDAGCDQFMIHKNLMYKSLVKKNYEHVISIKF